MLPTPPHSCQSTPTEPLSTVITSVVKPSKIARETWERLKPIIIALYLEENRSLLGQGGVIEVLNSRHGFLATASQYQSQFRRWALKKNKATTRNVNRSQIVTRVPSDPHDLFPKFPIPLTSAPPQGYQQSGLNPYTDLQLNPIDGIEKQATECGRFRPTDSWANFHDIPSPPACFLNEPSLTSCDSGFYDAPSITGESMVTCRMDPCSKPPRADFTSEWSTMLSPAQLVSEVKINLEEATDISSAEAQKFGGTKAERDISEPPLHLDKEAELVAENCKVAKEPVFEDPMRIGSWARHESPRLKSNVSYYCSADDSSSMIGLLADTGPWYPGARIIRESQSRNETGMSPSLNEVTTQDRDPLIPTLARPSAQITKSPEQTSKGQSSGNHAMQISSLSSIASSTFVAKQHSAANLEEPRTTLPAEAFQSTPESPETDKNIRHWVDGAKAAESVPVFTPSYADATPKASNPLVVDLTWPSEDLAPTASRKLVLELRDILYTLNQEELDGRDEESSSCGYFSAEAGVSDITESPGDANDQSGPSSSPKSSTTLGNASGGPQSLKRPCRQDWETSEGQDDDEPPSKKPNREQGQFVADDKASSPNELLMPCPLRENQKCLGTNPTISELLRCLGTNHQIVICIECCAPLEFPSGGKKVEEILSDHKGSEECVRRCISQSCAGYNGPYHLRTPKCPSMRKIPNELWRFIWTLVNPGQEAPVLQFSTGIGCLHDTVRRPRTRRASDKIKRNRAHEIAQRIEEDLESKDRRIKILEIELKAANDRFIHVQRRHDDRLQQCAQKASEQDEIVLDLLERLIKSGGKLEPSLQKRLKRVCPDVFEEALGGAKAIPSNLPPTPDPTMKKRPLATPSKTPSFSDLPLFENSFIPRIAALPQAENTSMGFSSMPQQQTLGDASQPLSAHSSLSVGGLFGVGNDCIDDGFMNNTIWLDDFGNGSDNRML
ncbi:hypothetical protein BKA66DRAFT_476788 [Pyrenochaeta sp. MPI-SDFR-AT-0127]|nr:hypothetical protein BKA66DRAFT_476788 [Pyrenochaeta sp. MPI-SDFR-AT-0127]